MSPLTSLPLADLLDRIAAPTPAPGGGAAAAIAGALGASVSAMVASLPRTRHDTPDERTRLDLAARDLAAHRVALARLADDDTAAVAALMAAARLPHSSAADADARRQAIAAATREATRVPLETSRLCAEALERTRDVAAAGARVAVSDIFVAIGLLKAAADGAASNVRANIEGLADETFVRETTRQLTRTLDAVARAAHASMATLQD
ncbi:MAG: cyclodeaminase/cyclohydrolase family protein [Acidobacteria bacterium]|nr:cyclodeaminase/cyclohydrolase family protein [Acidobacteriota bacterium]